MGLLDPKPEVEKKKIIRKKKESLLGKEDQICSSRVNIIQAGETKHSRFYGDNMMV
jgi:hypothetical protein